MSEGLSKAVIVARELNDEVHCLFNPREYSVSKSATWSRTPVRGAESASLPEFVGTNPRSLQVELFFDAFATMGDVSTDIDRLLSWTNPTRASIDANTPTPPIVYFQWGTKPLFDAFVRQVNARYTMFRPDGAPLRAQVNVSFEEVPREPARQNPTSGGEPGKRTHVVQPSDSLPLIAHGMYGQPGLWRAIAAFNKLPDPMRLEPGMVLLIPPQALAREMS